MNQYLTYIAIAFGVLLVGLLIPGVKVIAEAILKLIMEMLVTVFKHKGTFAIWFVKTLFSDHARVLQHAFQSRDTIDPTQKIRRKANGHQD